MKKTLAIAICSLPFAVMPVAYGQATGAPPADAPTTTNGTAGTAGTATPPSPGAGTSTTTDTSPMTPASPRDGTAPGAGTTDVAPRAPGDMTTTTPAAGGDAAMADAATGWSVKDNIMGKAVYNENDEKVGDISDIILSADGKTNYFVVGVGGFIGMGERKVAIPFDKFTHTEDKISVQGYTKEQLKEMPEFKLAR